MPENITERLSQFTPDGSGLDRDGLLIAAGRASARPSRAWALATGLLAASQLVTLVLLWPRPLPSTGTMVERPAAPSRPALSWPAEESTERPAADSVLAARDVELPRPEAVQQLIPADPPLHAFDSSASVGLP